MECTKCGRDIDDMKFSIQCRGFYAYIKIKCKCGRSYTIELTRG